VGKSISIVMGVGNVPIGKPKRILIAIRLLQSKKGDKIELLIIDNQLVI
jgi:hypothetical protein